jgi:hypothetical protein
MGSPERCVRYSDVTSNWAFMRTIRRTIGTSDRSWLLVALLVAIPVLVLIVTLAQRAWYPTGDLAQAELRMRSLPRLDAVLAVVTLLAVVAVSRIVVALYLYVFRWIVAIVALQVFTLGWGVATLLPRPTPTVTRRLARLAHTPLNEPCWK